MVKLDPGTDGVLVSANVRQQQVAAGDFDVIQQLGGRIDATVLAHETDRAIKINIDATGGRKTGFKCFTHDYSPLVKIFTQLFKCSQTRLSGEFDFHSRQPVP
jgi:hypothetical protein